MEANPRDRNKSDLLEKDDILSLVDDIAIKTENWLRGMDLNSENTSFPWTGKTSGSIALFLLRHSQYHLGEMNFLLNDQLRGKAEDYFLKENNY